MLANTTLIRTCFRGGAANNTKTEPSPEKLGHSETDASRIANLKRLVGRLTMENDLLKKGLAEARGRNVVKDRHWNQRMTELITQVANDSPHGARAITAFRSSIIRR